MLVLSRAEDESIIIGDTIEICVVRIDNHTVKLGIRAPRTVSVHRKEVYDAILKTNQEAIASPSTTKLTLAKAQKALSQQTKT